MQHYILSIIFLFLLTACGGGNSASNKNQPSIPVPANSTPVISSAIGIVEQSGNGKVEASEPFQIFIKITDSDNDAISGSVTIDNISASLEIYTGEDDFTHQVTFTLDTKGEKTASISATDNINSSISQDIGITVFPNTNEVQENLSTNIVDFHVGGQIDDIDLLGWNIDDLKRNIGYVADELNEEYIQYNGMPYGECGINRPHKLLTVEITTLYTTVPEVGVVYPLECLTNNQLKKVKQLSSTAKPLLNSTNTSPKNYIAQNYLITQYNSGEIGIVQTGEGIKLEGHVNEVVCEGLTAIKQDDSYVLTNQQIIDNLASLFDDNATFELSCQRLVSHQGKIHQSALLAKITGKLILADYIFPKGSIDSVSFSIPHQDGGLDAGNVCVTTSANDNQGIATEVLTVNAEDGLMDSSVMQYDNGKYCSALTGYDGNIYIKQQLTDFTGNTTEVISNVYKVEKNDAPEFSSALPETLYLRVNQSVVTIIESKNISDPEGHEFTLSGEVSFDTEQSPGSYTITAKATDQYGAESTKTISIKLAENSAPTANIKILERSGGGDVWMYDGKVRADNVFIMLELTSNDFDGYIDSSTLRTDLYNSGKMREISDYSSTYKAGILFVEDETVKFEYQVTDNEGKDSKIAVLEFEVHQNKPPVYQGQTSYTISTGSCIAIEQSATDLEGDEIKIWDIEGDNWEPCFDNAGDYSLELTIIDDFGGYIDTTINIKVED